MACSLHNMHSRVTQCDFRYFGPGEHRVRCNEVIYIPFGSHSDDVFTCNVLGLQLLVSHLSTPYWHFYSHVSNGKDVARC